ncbi:MAG TPA: VOC family protein [Candidatus Paceibacterota bacterium]|nr:VOC family protein [Verrucomicrobiota bacterium]HSA10934.1 VOC family protein [Candidatus Paceibacterota bacterium]
MRILDSERGVPTTNLKHCVEFYTDVLGFTKVAESADRCTLALGSDQVVFRKAHKNEVRSLRDIGFSLDFRVSGIREYYDKVRAAGRAEITFELEFMQPGVWQFVLVDCNGYPVGFAM